MSPHSVRQKEMRAAITAGFRDAQPKGLARLSLAFTVSKRARCTFLASIHCKARTQFSMTENEPIIEWIKTADAINKFADSLEEYSDLNHLHTALTLSGAGIDIGKVLFAFNRIASFYSTLQDELVQFNRWRDTRKTLPDG